MIQYEEYKRRPPGVVLGPYEALVAQIAWLREALPQSEYVRYAPRLITRLSVSPKMKEKLFLAYLLYGRFDAFCGIGCLDMYLAGKGFQENRRELVGDFLLPAETWSPFSHSLESGAAWPLMQAAPQWDSTDERTVVTSCFRAMRRAGIRGYSPQVPGAESIPLRSRLQQAVANIASSTATGLVPTPWHADSMLLGLVSAVNRSVDTGIPFLSRDAAAPAWIRSGIETERRVLRLVFEEVDWLPRPATFKEAHAMAQDERLAGLRTYITEVTERARIEDLDRYEQLREQIRRDVKAFRSKPWAARVAKLLVYAAVPAEIVGMLCHSHVVGVSVASLGAACEWVARMCAKQRGRHWLSMSALPQYADG